jgi:hypothetical protein
MKEKMMDKLEAHHKRMMARLDSQLEKMEITDLETNAEETESESVHQKSLMKRLQ